MNFKNWLLTEEIWQNNTATVYHRTDPQNIKNILSTGWKVGHGDMYGSGLYTTFAIESQFTNYMESSYGTSLVKFKVTNLDQYLICQKSVAQQILGQNYKISDQLKRLNLTDLYTPEQIADFDKLMGMSKFSGQLAKDIYDANETLEKKAKGIIYYGGNDGYCLVKYVPIEDGTITILGYANDVPAKDIQKMQELQSNCRKNQEGKCENPWSTTTEKVSIRQLYTVPEEKREKLTSTKKLTPLKRAMLSLPNAKDKDSRIKFILSRYIDELSNHDVEILLITSQNKDEIAKIIIQNKKDLNESNVSVIIKNSKDHDAIGKLIVQTKKQITDDDISKIIDYATDKNQMIKFILHKIKEITNSMVGHMVHNAVNNIHTINFILQNKKDLTGSNISSMVINTPDKAQTAQILGSENLNKLKDNDLERVLMYADNPDEMIRILLKYKTKLDDNYDVATFLANARKKDSIIEDIIKVKKELSPNDIYHMFYFAKDVEKLAAMLGKENLSKLPAQYIKILISNTPNGDEIENIFKKYGVIPS
jgi:hypothetical protein